MRRSRWLAVAAVLAVALGILVRVPWVAQAATTTTSIQDTAQGTGVGQLQFSPNWSLCITTCDKVSDKSYEWTSTDGATLTIRFSGSQIKLFGVKEPWSYISTVAIDGGSTVDVDEYAATATATSVQVWSSPTLTQGTHTLVMTKTGRRNTLSTGGDSITFDRADITSATTTPPASSHASGLPWSDGGFFMHDPNQVTAFAGWRGRPVDNIVAFTSRATWPAQLNNWWAGSVPSTFNPTRDDFILSVPLWTDNNDVGSDSDWRTLATEFAAVDPNGYIRLGWEMNCCFSKATSASTWTSQFSRAVTLMKSVAPQIRIVFNPNEGASGGGLIGDASTLFVPGKVDVIALDAYDWYPAYTTDANANNHFTKQYGWNWWYNFAQSKGLPFALGEFSVYSGSSASGGDNPAYFTYVYNWLSGKATAKPGSIAFVSVFNDNETYCGCNIYPTSRNPKAAARYKSLIASLAT